MIIIPIQPILTIGSMHVCFQSLLWGIFPLPFQLLLITDAAWRFFNLLHQLLWLLSIGLLFFHPLMFPVMGLQIQNKAPAQCKSTPIIDQKVTLKSSCSLFFPSILFVIDALCSLFSLQLFLLQTALCSSLSLLSALCSSLAFFSLQTANIKRFQRGVFIYHAAPGHAPNESDSNTILMKPCRSFIARIF